MAMNSKVLVSVAVVYLLLNLAFVFAVGYPIWWWLIVAVLTPVVVTFYLRLRDWYFRPPTGLDWLTEHIQLER